MIKLMIVDDSNTIRRRIERLVNLNDVSVVATAGNGLEAVRMFKKHRPDAVTMDITMPHMDGIQCVEALLRLRADTRILVISALADKATALEAIKKGANGFLCKPFNEDELNEALQELLED
jgi:two-component system chemotaxis response regulator CheY